MDIVTSVASILLGGGILAFIQFLISRHDSRHDKSIAILAAVEKVTKDVEGVKKDADERNAVLCRTHILRFRDELYNDVRHTAEYFEQTLDDIEVYERYCMEHPGFANGRTKAAAKFIKEEHERLFKEHKL